MCIERYRDAARGECDIHVFSYDNEPQLMITKEAGEPLDEEERIMGSTGWDSRGSEVPLTYDGIMTPQECLELAATLEARLEAHETL